MRRCSNDPVLVGEGTQTLNFPLQGEIDDDMSYEVHHGHGTALKKGKLQALLK